MSVEFVDQGDNYCLAQNVRITHAAYHVGVAMKAGGATDQELADYINGLPFEGGDHSALSGTQQFSASERRANLRRPETLV